jgi:hypothetical protein
VAAQALDDVGPAEQQPGLRPAEQLVAARGDHGAPARSAVRRRLVGQQRVRGEQPAAGVGDDRHAERGELGDLDGRVKPSTRKLLGCTLSTQPVSGPTASA